MTIRLSFVSLLLVLQACGLPPEESSVDPPLTWVGVYSYGGVGHSAGLTLMLDGSFTGGFGGCLGPSTRTSGTWRESDNFIEFELGPEKEWFWSMPRKFYKFVSEEDQLLCPSAIKEPLGPYGVAGVDGFLQGGLERRLELELVFWSDA